MGRGPATISKFCAKEGLLFDGSIAAPMMEAAVRTLKERQIVARDRRLTIEELYEARVLATLRDGKPWMTRQKTSGGGEQFVEVEGIPADDYRNITSASASNASAFRSYAPLETEQATEAGKSVLDKLIEAHQIPPEVKE